MVVLNFTFSGVSYQFFTKGLNSIFIESLILLRDVSITFLSVTLLDIFIYCLFNKIHFLHKILKLLLAAVSACMFAADIFSIYYFNMPINIIMLNTAMMTNLREGSEFLQTYLFNAGLWIFILIIALSLFVLRIIFMFIFRRKKLLLLLILLGVCLGCIALKRDYIVAPTESRFTNSVSISRIRFMLSNIYKTKQEYQKMIDEAPDNINLTRNDSGIPYVVFILGESTTRNHMQIYGYDLPTTPELKRLQEQGRLYVFEDVVSPHSLTHTSMQKLFTFCRKDSKREWFTYATVFNILKKAGYHTAWLSNQESSIGGDVTAFYKDQCDFNIFTEKLKENYKSSSLYDEVLLPILDNVLPEAAEKNFYLLHLLGAHSHYHKRYPERFEIFSANDETGGIKGISNHQRQQRARYDNAVLYNDFVVSEIIRRFEDKNAAVIYISDHGEEVYDTVNFEGHGHDMLTSNLEIPMLIWLSEDFSRTYPELEARIAESVNRPYMTDDMIHTLLDIMGIETDEYDPTKSIINPNFDATRPRIYSGHLYDKENGLHEVQ